MDELRVHDVVLEDGDVRLRPLTEDDWATIEPWETDPDVLWFSEGGDPRPWTIDEWKPIYRDISRAAEMFVVERAGTAVGTAWLQVMNLDFVRDALPDRELRRIDLQLDKAVWGHGVGTTVIRLLTDRAFTTGADSVFACGIWDFNERSQRAFVSNGYRHWRTVPVDGSAKGSAEVYLVCERS
jgi:RimJ/RimL family protein N-acetyltransferase